MHALHVSYYTGKSTFNTVGTSGSAVVNNVGGHYINYSVYLAGNDESMFKPFHACHISTDGLKSADGSLHLTRRRIIMQRVRLIIHTRVLGSLEGKSS